ncbi:unnamed protein product, partial [Iphiclides podalirius]
MRSLSREFAIIDYAGRRFNRVVAKRSGRARRTRAAVTPATESGDVTNHGAHDAAGIRQRAGRKARGTDSIPNRNQSNYLYSVPNSRHVILFRGRTRLRAHVILRRSVVEATLPRKHVSRFAYVDNNGYSLAAHLACAIASPRAMGIIGRSGPDPWPEAI